MQILIQKDLITGIETVTCINEPVELSKEEKEKEEKLWNSMLESMRVHNQFMNKVIESFWSLDVENFSETWNSVFKDYMAYKEATKENESDKVENDFKKSFVSKFVDSLSNKEKQNLFKNNLEQIFSIWSSQLNPEFFPLLVWQMNFKEQSLTLLEKVSCNFSSDNYDYIYDNFIKDFRRDLPLSVVEKENILSEEKSNFLQIQKTYCTFKKLNDKLVDKNNKSKFSKI